MLVALASVLLLHAYRPYADGADQLFALAAAWQLVLAIFAGLVMGLNADEQDDAAREQYALLLCAAVGGTLLIVVLLILLQRVEKFAQEHRLQRIVGPVVVAAVVASSS